MNTFIIQRRLHFGKPLRQRACTQALSAVRLFGAIPRRCAITFAWVRQRAREPLCRWLFLAALAAGLVSCQAWYSANVPPSPVATDTGPLPTGAPPNATVSPFPSPTATVSPSPSPTATATLRPLVPNFAHIVIIVLENREFGSVIGRSAWPTVNRWAQEYTLLTQYYAITHPSLPNYLALIGGDTFGITTNCTDCFVDAPTLVDQLEATGRDWKGYFEDMPRPCYLGDTATYVQKHNPFLYFDSIRNNPTRCERSVVPLTQLESDLAADSLPAFSFIVPNQCNNGHDCASSIADAWLAHWVNKLLVYLQPRAARAPYLLVITWEEGQGDRSCCGLPEEAGGRVPLILISPLAKQGFQDDTPYTHYSLLKTVELAWGLPYLGHAADEMAIPILTVWK